MLCCIILLVFGLQVALATPGLSLASNIKSRQSNTITVNLDQTYQKMDGFGFSQAFGTAYTIMNLPTTQQKQALDFLFNKTTGAGLTILRNGINVDVIEPASPGSPSTAPTYAWDGSDGAQVWVSQQAQTYGVSRFYADSWSAPAFMKTNDDESNGGYLCGVTGETCSSGDWKQAYANLIVQYIKDYQSAGVQITQVGFLNEPDVNASYSSMLSDGTQAADFIKVLYPSLQAAGLDVGITCCDAEGWNSQETMTAQLISAGVEGMLSRITSHSYTSSPTSPMNTTLPVWETEYCDLSGSFSTTWYSTGDLSEGMAWANLIYTGVVDANLSAYLHWYGVDNTGAAGCLVNVNGTEVEASAKLWAFAQWSRFVQPGAIRLGTSSSGLSNVQVSAFRNTDGSVSVQILNNAASVQSFSLSASGGGFTATAAKAYITNNSNLNVTPYSVSLSGGLVSTSIPAYSMVTVVLTGAMSGGGGSSTKTTSATPTTGHSTKTISPASTSSSSSASTATGTQTHWNQCGGIGYSGPTQCQPPYSCSSQNAWYSQCL